MRWVFLLLGMSFPLFAGPFDEIAPSTSEEIASLNADLLPNLGRWLTPDPIGSLNHSNLYQYLFNNPYLYHDENGEFAFVIPLLFWGAELALPTLSACITAITYTAAAGAVAYGGYKLVETFNDRGCPSMGDHDSGGLTSGLDNWSYSTMKNGSVCPELSPNSEKQHNPDQAAISDLVKGTGKKGVSNQDADTLLDWAKEYNFPHRDDRGKDHWVGGEHIHIGPKHVPIQK